MGLVKMLFLRHAYSVLFGWVLVEQAGLPIPSVPLMLAAGTMSAAHKVHMALVLPVDAAGVPDRGHAWWWLGRRFGSRVLDLLCRMSLDASTCVNRAQGLLRAAAA